MIVRPWEPFKIGPVTIILDSNILGTGEGRLNQSYVTAYCDAEPTNGPIILNVSDCLFVHPDGTFYQLLGVDWRVGSGVETRLLIPLFQYDNLEALVELSRERKSCQI